MAFIVVVVCGVWCDGSGDSSNILGRSVCSSSVVDVWGVMLSRRFVGVVLDLELSVNGVVILLLCRCSVAYWHCTRVDV